MKPFIELAIFKTKGGFTPEWVGKAVEEARDFLKNPEGLFSKTLCRNDDGTWYDILFWEYHGRTMAIMHDATDFTHCFALFGSNGVENDCMLLFSSLTAVSVGDLMRISSMFNCNNIKAGLGWSGQKLLCSGDFPTFCVDYCASSVETSSSRHEMPRRL